MNTRKFTREDLENRLKANRSLSEVNPYLSAGSTAPRLASQSPQESSEGRSGHIVPIKLPKKRGMNKTEAQFEAILRHQHPFCEVLYERYTFKLADDLRYTPDFAVVYLDEKIDFYEVKGRHIFSRALHKPKMAADMFLHRFYLAQKTDSGWEVTRLKGKVDK